MTPPGQTSNVVRYVLSLGANIRDRNLPSKASSGSTPPLAGRTYTGGWLFTALYAVANLGAFIAFIPLLQILVPLRAAAIAVADPALLLSRVAFAGAVAASLGNIASGMLSDRTLRRTGGRRRWVLGGLAGMCVSYALIERAASPSGLLWSVILFQVAFNAMFAPLGAVLADNIAEGRRGFVSSLLGLGYPLGNLIGTQLIGNALVGQAARFGVLALIVSACIVPFACLLRPVAPVEAHGPGWRAVLLLHPFRHKDFSYALASRVLIVTAFSIVQGYLLLDLQQLTSNGVIGAARPEAAFANLAAIATGANIVCALIGGAASDRAGRRGWFVLAAGVVMAAGIAILAGAEGWRGLQAGSLVYGCGAGLFYAVDLALVVQVLPSLQNAGRDLGIVNLSNTLPQAMAPLIALALLGQSGLSFRALFLCGAGAALLGAVLILRLRNR